MPRFIFALCLLGMVVRPALAEEVPRAIRIAEHAARVYEMDLLKVQIDSLQAGRDDAADDLSPEDRIWFKGEIFRLRSRLEKLQVEEFRARTAGTPRCGLFETRPPRDLRALSPMLSGSILRIRKNFVEISIGSDDGLEVGHLLDVHREGERGRIVIRRTDPYVAVGEIIPESAKLPIRQGDFVTPHWESQRDMNSY